MNNNKNVYSKNSANIFKEILFQKFLKKLQVLLLFQVLNKNYVYDDWFKLLMSSLINKW